MKLKRIGIGFLAIIACFHPSWVSLLNGIGLQKVRPEANDFEKLCNWDCLHYSEIVLQLKPTAWLPLMPWISKIWAQGFGTSPNLAVMITSCLFSIFCGFILLFLGRTLAGEGSADFSGFPKESWILLALVTFFPHFHFWMQGYSEPVFFAFLSLGFLFLVQERWLPACALLGMTVPARPQGMWVMGLAGLLLLISYFKQCWNGPKKLSELICSLALLSVPCLIFAIWSIIHTGVPFYFLIAQHQWGRSVDIGLGLRSHLPNFSEDTFMLYLSLWAAYTLLKERKNLAWVFLGLLTLAFAEIPLFFGAFISYTRIQSVNLGLFLVLNRTMIRNPRFLIPWLIWSVSRLAVFSHSMTFKMWVG